MCHIGTWSTRYCVRTVEKVEVKSEKIWFVECQKMTLGKSPLCRVSGKGLTEAALCRVFWFAECPTLDTPGLCRVLLFAECSALGKPPICRVPVVCRVLSPWHSANSLFVERPIKSTRQSLEHSAKKSSPIVEGGVKRVVSTPSALCASCEPISARCGRR